MSYSQKLQLADIPIGIGGVGSVFGQVAGTVCFVVFEQISNGLVEQ